MAPITEFALEQIFKVSTLAETLKLGGIRNRRIQDIFDAKIKVGEFYYENIDLKFDAFEPRKGSSFEERVELDGSNAAKILQCRALHLENPTVEVIETCILPAAKIFFKIINEITIQDYENTDSVNIENCGRIIKECSNLETLKYYGNGGKTAEELIMYIPKKIGQPLEGQRLALDINPAVSLTKESMDLLMDRAGAWPIELRLTYDLYHTDYEDCMDAIIYLFKNSKTEVAVRWSCGVACFWEMDFERPILAAFPGARKMPSPPESTLSGDGDEAEQRIVFKVGNLTHYMSFYCREPLINMF